MDVLSAPTPAYAHMYGYANPEEMMVEVTDVGRQLYANPKDREAVLLRIREKGFMEPREMTVVRRDGTRFFVLVGARGDQRFRRELVLLSGCTRGHHARRKRAEEALSHRTQPHPHPDRCRAGPDRTPKTWRAVFILATSAMARLVGSGHGG